ncbi:MAG: TIGR04283 family arsenosugar biosynthesis glycosyltransferase [Bacteroidota bacterium]|nr:TIGR04283 family arsenosugar biosynthesis glycosyltransferase [Bacteroidota bacterium]
MISVIIPTYNEVDCILNTIEQLKLNDTSQLIKEIIISDGASTDATCNIESSKVKIVHAPIKGRAAQMNYGATFATGDILYFLHADTIPPKDFTSEIISSIQNGNGAGCYRLSFDYQHWFLKANCWFTRFDIDSIRFGDQSLFVAKDLFKKAGGFSEKHIVLEDQHFISKIKKLAKFQVLKKEVTTSARKYLENGIYKTQAIFFLIYFMYRMGYSQQKLVATYRRLITQNKI